MNKKFKATAIVAIAASITLGGCYNYVPVTERMVGNSFTERDLSQSDDIFASIETLSLQQAQEIAVMNNPTYISAYHSVNAAKMRYYQALGQFSPTVTASFALSQTHNDYTNRATYSGYTGDNRYTYSQTGITASMVIFDGLSRYFQAMAYKHSYDYTAAMEENSRRLLMQAVAFAYNDILLAEAQREIAISDHDFQLKNIDATKSKLSAGAVAESELLNFQIYANDAINDQIAAEYTYDNAIFTLATLLGYSEGVLPKHVNFDSISVNLDEPLASIDVYLDAALNNRPDLKAYNEAIEVAKYSLYNTYSAFSPTVSGYATYNLNTYSYKYYGYQTTSGSTTYSYDASRSYYNNPQFTYGVSADWVLFNGAQRYNATREAQASLAGSQYDLASQWLTVVQEVRAAYANYVTSVKQARVSGMNLTFVERRRELVQYEYDFGKVALTSLNEAQSQYVSNQLAYTSALISIINAKAQLEAAVSIDSTGYSIDDRYIVGDKMVNALDNTEE